MLGYTVDRRPQVELKLEECKPPVAGGGAGADPPLVGHRHVASAGVSASNPHRPMDIRAAVLDIRGRVDISEAVMAEAGARGGGCWNAAAEEEEDGEEEEEAGAYTRSHFSSIELFCPTYNQLDSLMFPGVAQVEL